MHALTADAACLYFYFYFSVLFVALGFLLVYIDFRGQPSLRVHEAEEEKAEGKKKREEGNGKGE